MFFIHGVVKGSLGGVEEGFGVYIDLGFWKTWGYTEVGKGDSGIGG